MRDNAIQALPSLVTLGIALSMLLYGPIAQFPDYHHFADQRTLAGIPRAFDVLSNVGFAVVGVWGFQRVVAGRSYGYGLFVVSLFLTSIGSAFYHLNPDDGRLVWDRLPIALACAGLLAAVYTESRHRHDGRGITFILALAAVTSVYWWVATADLRPYLLLQVLPLILIPLWQWIYRADRKQRLAFAIAIVLYVVAKIAELNDHALFAATGILSGHTLKHLLAAAAAAIIVGQVRRSNAAINLHANLPARH